MDFLFLNDIFFAAFNLPPWRFASEHLRVGVAQLVKDVLKTPEVRIFKPCLAVKMETWSHLASKSAQISDTNVRDKMFKANLPGELRMVTVDGSEIRRAPVATVGSLSSYDLRRGFVNPRW